MDRLWIVCNRTNLREIKLQQSKIPIAQFDGRFIRISKILLNTSGSPQIF